MIIIAFILNFIFIIYGQRLIPKIIGLYKISPTKIVTSKFIRIVASGIGIIIPTSIFYLFWDSEFVAHFRNESVINITLTWIFFTIIVPLLAMNVCLILGKIFGRTQTTISYFALFTASGAFSAILITPLISATWFLVGGMLKAAMG